MLAHLRPHARADGATDVPNKARIHCTRATVLLRSSAVVYQTERALVKRQLAPFDAGTTVCSGAWRDEARGKRRGTTFSRLPGLV